MATVTYGFTNTVPPFQVDTFYAVGTQNNPAIATLKNGSFIGAWHSVNGSYDAIDGAVVTRAGVKTAEDYTINYTTTGVQSEPALAVLNNGNAVLAYTDYSSGTAAVRFRVFSPSLLATTASDTLLYNSGTDIQYTPKVAAGTGGGFAVAWQQQYNGSATDYDAWVAVYDASGNPVIAKSVASTSNLEEGVRIAALSNGNYVEVWDESSGGNSVQKAQILSASGANIGSVLTLDSVGSLNDQADVVGLPNGNFAVVHRNNSAAGGSDPSDIYFRVFDQNGSIISNAYLANSGTAAQTNPKITLLSNGFAAVAYTEGSDSRFVIVDPAAPNTILTSGILIPSVTDYASTGLAEGRIGGLYSSPGTSGTDVFAYAFDITRTTTATAASGETLTGDDLRDTINGGAGPDTINGGGGADTITGGGGADTLTGGTGSDIFRYNSVSESTAGAPDTITDFRTGEDKLDVANATGSGGAVVINRSGESSTFFFQTSNGAGGQARVNINGPVQGYDLTLAANTTLFFNGAAGADTLIGTSGTDYISGGDGADTLTGGAGADFFRYFSVADSTASARDTITDFQTGVDKIDVSAAIGIGGAVVLNRSGESSVVFFQTANGAGGQAQVQVNGPVQGYDVITGANTTFFINGAAGADTLIGAPNATNYLSGGQGADTLTGGSGTDYFRYFNVSDSTAGARDTITNFQTGVDKIDLSAAIGSGGAVVLNRSGESTVLFFQTANGAGGQAQVAVNGPVQGYDVITGANTTFFINGAAGADTLIGAPNATNYLSGGQGADTLTGGSGTDYFRYFNVSDSIPGARDTITNFQTGVDKLDVSAAIGSGGAVVLNRSGESTLFFFQTANGAGGQAQVQVNGPVQGYDVITGANTTFFINGADGADTLIGAPNATNYLSGGQGADTLTGGSGTDYFRYFGLGDSTAGARDTITNFQTGMDKIDISALGGGQVSLSYVGSTTILNFTPSGSGTQLQLLAIGQVTPSDVLTSGGVTFGAALPSESDPPLYSPAAGGEQAPYGTGLVGYLQAHHDGA